MDKKVFKYHFGVMDFLVVVVIFGFAAYWLYVVIYGDDSANKWLVTAQVLFVLVHSLIHIGFAWGGRLLFSAEGIEYRGPISFFRWQLAYEKVDAAWWSNSSVLGNKLVLELNGRRSKEFYLKRWRLEGEEVSDPITDSQLYRTALEHLPLEYVADFRAMIRRRNAQHADVDGDLGESAKYVTVAFVVSSVFALIGGMVFSQWYSLTSIDRLYAVFPTVLVVGWILSYLFKNKASKSVSIFLALLCSLSFFFSFMTILRLEVGLLGKDQTYVYQLDAQALNWQEWRRVDGAGAPVWYRNLNGDNQIYQKIGQQQRLTVRESLGMSVIHVDELKKVRRVPEWGR